MATFGKYETTQAISSGGLCEVWRARGPGQAKARFVVKVCQPNALLAEEKDAELRIALFLVAARQQEELTVSRAGHWARIVESGVLSDGRAYYVTRLCKSSAAYIISRKIALTGEKLHEVVRGVVEGLVELRRLAGRSHGNLKATNILIRTHPKVSSSKVLLTDLAGGAPAGAEGESADLRALGQLIYEMTRAASAETSSQWSQLGPKGEGWRKLCDDLLSAGTNDLDLDAVSREVARLRDWHAGCSKWAIRAAMLLAVVGAGWYVHSRIIIPPEDLHFVQRCDRYQKAWFNWAKNYLANDATVRDSMKRSYGQTVEDFEDAYNKAKEVVEQGKAHPRARRVPEIVQRVDGAYRAIYGNLEVDPERTLYRDPNCLLGTMYACRQLVSELAGDANDRGAARERQFFLLVASRLGDVPNAAETMQFFREREQEATRALTEVRTCNEAVRRLFDLVKAIGDDSVLRRAPGVIRAASAQDSGIKADWPDRRDDLERIRLNHASLDPTVQAVLSAVPDPVIWRTTIDWECIRTQSDVAPLYDSNRDLTVVDLQRWADTVRQEQFRLRPGNNPLKEGLSSEFLGLVNALNQLQQEDRDGKSYEACSQGFHRLRADGNLCEARTYCDFPARLAEEAKLTGAVQEALAKLKAEVDAQLGPPREKDPRDPVKALLMAVPQQIDLAQDANLRAGYVRRLQEADRVFQDVKEIPFIQANYAYIRDHRSLREASALLVALKGELRTPSVDWELLARMDFRIQAMPGDASAAELGKILEDIRGKAKIDSNMSPATKDRIDSLDKSISAREAVRAKLDQLGRGVPQDVQAEWIAWLRQKLASPTDSAAIEGLAFDLAEALARADANLAALGRSFAVGWARPAFEQQRKAVLRKLVQEANGAPDPNAERQQIASVAAWCGKAATLDADLAHVDSLLEKAYGLDEKPDGKESIRDVHARYWVEPGGIPGGVADCGEVTGPRDKIKNLIRIAEESAATHDLVQEATKGNSPAVRFNVWRRLCESNRPCPSSPSDLDGVPVILKNLKDQAGQMIKTGDAARGRQLKEELDREGRKRWCAWFEQAPDGKAVSRLLVLESGFGSPGDGNSLSVRGRYNYLVGQFFLTEKEIDARIDADPNGALERDFRELGRQVALLPKDAEVEKEWAPWGKALARGGQASASGGDLKSLGPARAGWEIVSQSDDAIVYRFKDRNSDLSLCFRKVEPGGAAAAAYLCTSEATVGLCQWLVDRTRDATLVQDLANTRKMLRVQGGPCAWDVRNNKIYQADTWLLMMDARFTEGTPAHDRQKSYYDPSITRPRPPSLRTPMQRISAADARRFAGLVGCRLPTAGEWAAACGTTDPNEGNLRGPTWSKQVAYLTDTAKLLGTSGGDSPPPYPDQGIFSPKKEPRVPAATSARPRDHGVLWFAEAGARSADFEHLFGNVAEFVTAEPNSASVQVIGGSSLSPPDMDPQKPQPAGSGAYSDVGFRPAFSAPASSWRNTLKALLHAPPPYALGTEADRRPTGP